MRMSSHVVAYLFALTGMAFGPTAGTGGAEYPSRPHRPFCSIAWRPWAYEGRLAYVIIGAHADTIPATVYRYRLFQRLGYPRDTLPPLPTPDVVVYGQRTRILRAVGLPDSAIAANSDAALVEWSHNSMCQSTPPERANRALSLPAGTVALIGAIPRTDTIAPPGVVVINLRVGTRFYAPEFERQAQRRSWRRLWRRSKVLSIEEYESLLRSLSPWVEWDNAPERAIAGLEAWARANPALARREPARSILRGAREEVDARATGASR
jgi:hypothetical protein